MADDQTPPDTTPPPSVPPPPARMALPQTELQKENDRLRRELQSATDKLRGRGPAPQVEHDLKAENMTLKMQLADLSSAVAANHGPGAGTKVCYQAPGEPFCRPGRVLSDGFSHREPIPGGFTNYCHLEYGEPPWITVVDHESGKVFNPSHTFETDRPYHPMAAPGTWHCLDECPHAGEERVCPYGAEAAKAVADRLAKIPPQAP